MNNKFIYYFRWLMVLPGSIIFGILVTFPLHWFLYIAFVQQGATFFGIIEFPEGIDIYPIEYALYPAVMAFTFIYSGFKIAPKYKDKTATVLLVLYSIMWLIISFMALLQIKFSKVSLQFSARTILAFLGAFAGWYSVRKATGNTKNE